MLIECRVSAYPQGQVLSNPAAVPRRQAPTVPNWIHEIKHDGYRLASGRSPDWIWIKSKNSAAPAATAEEDWGAADAPPFVRYRTDEGPGNLFNGSNRS
jgi:hypothetical protein